MDWLRNGMLAASKRRAGAAGDPFLANVYYMANYEGTLTPEINLGTAGQTGFGTVLNNGGVEIDSGDYIQTASGCCPALPGAFTIEAWLESTTQVSYGGIVGSTDLSWVVSLDSYANMQIYTPVTGWIVSTSTTRLGNQKVHLALSYTPGALSFCRNGVRLRVHSPYTSFIGSGTIMHIGNFSAIYALRGVLHSLRITDGVARYSAGSTYIVPPESFPTT